MISHHLLLAAVSVGPVALALGFAHSAVAYASKFSGAVIRPCSRRHEGRRYFPTNQRGGG
jgi:hypothetical protein